MECKALFKTPTFPLATFMDVYNRFMNEYSGDLTDLRRVW